LLIGADVCVLQQAQHIFSAGTPMKNQLSETATVYEKENSCLEDILEIADKMKLKPQPVQQISSNLRHMDPIPSAKRPRMKSRI
jgi:hypothetical protein